MKIPCAYLYTRSERCVSAVSLIRCRCAGHAMMSNSDRNSDNVCLLCGARIRC
uniref:Uncharacterized protein n=1 Tax=Anopheles albimanus TaxID=7167 RepID=A0A182FYP0_ANOAL